MAIPRLTSLSRLQLKLYFLVFLAYLMVGSFPAHASGKATTSPQFQAMRQAGYLPGYFTINNHTAFIARLNVTHGYRADIAQHDTMSVPCSQGQAAHVSVAAYPGQEEYQESLKCGDLLDIQHTNGE